MVAEISTIRFRGSSPYVKITKQFKEMSLKEGDEVQVMVVPVRDSMIKVQDPIASPGQSDEEIVFDVAVLSKQFRSTYPPFVHLSMAEAQNRIQNWGGSSITDEQRVQILAYMSTRGML